MSKYICWQCGIEFNRKDDEIRCKDCATNPENIKTNNPQFIGQGFYKNSGGDNVHEPKA